MNIREYTDLLDRFHQGRTSEEENRQLRGLIGSSPDSLFEQYSREKWNGSSNEIPESLKDKMKSDIFQRINILEDLEKKTRRRRAFVWIRTAAVAASVCIASFLGYHFANVTRPVQEFEVVADRGQKSEVTLPDGSKVWLNSASRIRYTSDYNGKNRNIALSGEAYFEVAKNEDIPFIVNAKEVSVKALGTKFNVESYPDDYEIVTTLIEGRVLTAAKGKSEILEPMQQSVYNRKSDTLKKDDVPSSAHPVPWRNDEIFFDGESLAQIAPMLERMYNVKVIIGDSRIAEYTYTGLIRNNSLQNVLDLISGTSPVKYRMNGNTIKLSPR